MIKLNYLEGRQIMESTEDFSYLVSVITNSLKTVKEFKVDQLIPCTKGLGLHNITIWDSEKIETEMFKGSLVIGDGKNSLSINKDINVLIRPEGIGNKGLELFLQDYGICIRIQY